MGKEMTVDVKDVKDTEGGDIVKIIDGIIEELTEKPGKSKKLEKPRY